MSDLRALAEQYVRLSSEIEGVRQAMLASLTNGAGENRPFVSPSRETGESGEAGCGGGGGGEDPGADPGAADADVGDRAGDGGGGVDDDPAAEKAQGAGPDRGRRRGRLARRLSAAETADLIAPGPRPYAAWIVPLTSERVSSVVMAIARYG